MSLTREEANKLKAHEAEQRQVIYGLEKDREMWKAAAQLYNGKYEQQEKTIQRLREALQCLVDMWNHRNAITKPVEQAQRVLEETK